MQTLLQIIEGYGFFAILLAVFLEYACFPVSSEIILPLSGALCAGWDIPFLAIVPASVCAGLLGTYLCYLIGRFGGERLLAGIIRRFPSAQKGIDASRERFTKHGNLTVFFLRMVPLCRTYIAFVAGAFGMPTHLYLSASLLGITIWNSLLIAAGYKLGAHWQAVETWYASYKKILLPALAILLLALVFRRLQKRQMPVKNA